MREGVPDPCSGGWGYGGVYIMGKFRQRFSGNAEQRPKFTPVQTNGEFRKQAVLLGVATEGVWGKLWGKR